jgi:ribulose-phosphate 3-epimerase
VSAGDRRTTRPRVNIELVERVRRNPGIELSGSLYAAEPESRSRFARELIQEEAWLHADLFDDPAAGVDLDLVRSLADRGDGRVDVHLLTAGSLLALDAVCDSGVARVTFPFEDVDDPAAISAGIRAAGPRPWLAIAPGTEPEACIDVLPYIDGVLVMLLEPGTSGPANPDLLSKVTRLGTEHGLPVGVDGGVGEHNLADVIAAGADYIVIGRRLIAVTAPRTEEPRV